MKKLLGLIGLVITITCGACITASANMNSIDLFTNRGQNSIVINNAIDGENDWFVKLNDIREINLDYSWIDGDTYSLGREEGPLEYTIIADEGIIEADEVYENAAIIKNDKTYVSVSVLAELFSYPEKTVIDLKNGIVSLWINDYTTETYWANFEVDESIPISEEGLETTLYFGRKTMTSIGVGAAIPFPEKFEGVDTTIIPDDTDIFNMGYAHSVKQSETYTFYDNARTKEIYYDVVVRQPYTSSGGSSSGGSSMGGSAGGVGGYYTAGYKIDNDACVGGNFEKISNQIINVTITAEDCFEPIIISGTVTVPTRSNSIGYSIIAEGNNRSVLENNGTYVTKRDFVTSQTGELGSTETKIDYILRVKPNQDYVVCVRFDNGYYVRQYVLFDDLVENKVQNFNNFEKSKSITGQLILPSDVTSFTDHYGNTIDSVYCYLTLQGSEAPYYVVQEIELELTPDMDSVSFELFDDLGIENGIISYRIYREITELYESAVYFSGSSLEIEAEKASVIPTDSKDIEFNMMKGKIVEIIIRCEVNSGIDLYLAYGDITSNPDELVTNILGHQVDYASNTSGGYKATYNFIMPDNGMNNLYYYPYIEDIHCPNDRLYCAGLSKWEKTPTDYYSIPESTTTTSNFKYLGYDPAIPVEVSYNGISINGEKVYGFMVDSCFDYDATIYVAYYGENKKLLHVETVPQTFDAYMNYELYFTLDSTYEPLAEEIKMFVWTDALRPLSNAITIKSAK